MLNYFCLLLLNVLGGLITFGYNGNKFMENVILKGQGQRRPGCGRRCYVQPNPRPNPPDYICVPAGTCPTNPNIDVRIVTPNQPTPSICPPGQVPCYNQNQQLIDCGRRTVGQVSNFDGPSTYGAFPWQAYIENQTHYTGSGVLITQNYILTAAHKVNFNRYSPQNIRIYLGVWDATQRTSAQIRSASQISIPGNFNPNTLHNDLAVVRLNQPVQLGNNIAIACLPSQGQQFIGQRCVVAGWGQTAFKSRNAPTSKQKQVFVTIVDHATCRNKLSHPAILGSSVDAFLDPNGEFCAGGELNRDACTQDGGAPLVCQDGSGRFIVAGLVIWGKGCGRRNVYGVYVDVSKYRNYIDTNTRK